MIIMKLLRNVNAMFMREHVRTLVLVVNRLLWVAILILGPTLLYGQHYVAGVLGIESSTVPCRGLYTLDYGYFYSAGQLNNPSGNKLPPGKLNALVYVQVPRVVWIASGYVLKASLGF